METSEEPPDLPPASRVTILSTPPRASAPYSGLWGPRINSMRSMSPVGRFTMSNPSGLLVLRISIPSMSNSVCLGSVPRTYILVFWPGPPVRVRLTPGDQRKRSATKSPPIKSISSRPKIDRLPPISDSSASILCATVTCSGSSSCA